MNQGLLGLFRLGLLALMYLFLLRVLRAVWTEVRGPTTTKVAKRKTVKPTRAEKKRAQSLVALAPAALVGTSYELDNETTLGRAPGCQVWIDDSFASQIHARVFFVDHTAYLEDLGSTNGTLVNGQRVHGQVPLRRGDRVAIGATELELR
jgi:pSer/pThr/pTyr-binding forkhead associated (FHA) protein